MAILAFQRHVCTYIDLFVLAVNNKLQVCLPVPADVSGLNASFNAAEVSLSDYRQFLKQVGIYVRATLVISFFVIT